LDLLHKTPVCYVTHSWHQPLLGILFILCNAGLCHTAFFQTQKLSTFKKKKKNIFFILIHFLFHDRNKTILIITKLNWHESTPVVSHWLTVIQFHLCIYASRLAVTLSFTAQFRTFVNHSGMSIVSINKYICLFWNSFLFHLYCPRITSCYTNSYHYQKVIIMDCSILRFLHNFSS